MPEIHNPVNMRQTIDGVERTAVVPEESVRGWLARGWEVADPEMAVKVAQENLATAQRQLAMVRGETPEDQPPGGTPPTEDGEAEAEDAKAGDKPTKSARATKASGGRK